MKTRILTMLALFFLFMAAVPMHVMAMKSMDHGNMSQGGGMAMGGSMIMLEDTETDGVTASGHLMDIRVKMAEHGMKTTHHFMVGFTDSMNMAIDNGQVAVKIEAPDGTVSAPINMMGMSGQFGADVTLDQPGTYHFRIGTKLADGTKRMFNMSYNNP